MMGIGGSGRDYKFGGGERRVERGKGQRREKVTNKSGREGAEGRV